VYTFGIAKADKTGARYPAWWVSTTYFAEGFPYAIVNNVAEVLFKELGASLQAIGLTAIFHLPWNLKFLWAPLLDHYETKRRFMLACEWGVIALLVALLVFGNGVSLWLASILFILLAFISATHDMAIDAYYLEALDRDEQARFVGLRAAAYRGAVVLASGPLLVVADQVGWRATWAASITVMVVVLGYHWTYLPDQERRQDPLRNWVMSLLQPRVAIAFGLLAAILLLEIWVPMLRTVAAEIRAPIQRIPALAGLDVADWVGLTLLLVMTAALLSLTRLRTMLARSESRYSIAFLHLLERPQMNRALVFIVLFRTGESFLMKMRQPFLRDECAMDLTTYGLVNGTLGFLATLVATLLGGWLIARHGLRRWLWPLVLAQNIPNLLYVLVAASPNPAELGTFVVGAVVIVEDFGAGLGTAVFMVYLLRCCDPRHKATSMAVLTAIMSIGFTIAGMASGFLVGALGGFASYFTFTFIATVPSMLMIPFVPFMESEPPQAPEAPSPPDR
jgi:PAT family beta-lactamase induction signal transducer AmpG